MSSKAAKEQARKDALVSQFRQVTGVSQSEAVRYLKKYNYRIDAALDGLFNDPSAAATLAAAREPSGAQATKKLGELFDEYKDNGGETMTVDGTMAFCQDINLDLDDVVLLALSYELKSPQMGEFSRTGWIEGWKALKCDSRDTMKAALPKLRSRLQNDRAFFRSIYMYAFDFARTAGQRSIPIDNAKAFWAMLLPAGFAGDALVYEGPGEGWKPEYNQLWFDFLDAKGGRGISRDTWAMFFEFILTIDSCFQNHDEGAAWPSLIDEFVEYSRERLRSA
ncbi:hypothetical protein BS47DRAFT_1330049 [Hydnum rufescens UP504]|uniref:Defective in cullin neddylation protein n=1 Tax=Hydnum rufescens UP504 TaxID=1448309 RepID=A0A9P6AVT3_9AGAM|nr:hypothetical protein BS47DRAFT_1330049 [Hydnum rufescens UP504]